MIRIELLTVDGCHLCDRAREMLQQVAPDIPVDPLDIAPHEDLVQTWGERLPVLRHGDQVLAWPFGLLDVQAFVDKARRPLY